MLGWSRRVRWKGVRAALALAVLAVAASASPVSWIASAAQPVTTQAAAFSGAAAEQQVQALAGQIGSRPAGSAAFDRAVDYAVDQLRQWGYQPTVQTFPLQVYDDRGSQIEVRSESTGSQAIAADTLTYSIAGQVEAPLVAAGLGQPTDIAGVDVHDKIALIKRGELRFAEKVANAAAAGAVGVIVYNDSPGRVQGSLTGPSAVPAATISGESGQQLLDQLTSGTLVARLVVDASTDQRSGSNVLADLPSLRPDAGSVVFGAHLDSVPAGPGANDNGSGSAVVLELAHELSQRSAAERPLTVRFALFGAEELGLYGSRYFVLNLSDAERHAILADVNLDMVGVGQSWRFGGTEDLVQSALGAANDLGQRALPLSGSLAGGSDHASFLEAGIPAVFIYRVEDPNYHTAGDVPTLVDADALTQAGTIALKLLDGLASQ
jgi:aminopeptidase YwaD